MKRAIVICGLVSLVGCQQQTVHRSPDFVEPQTTLFTSAVPCLESPEIAGGGRLIRRATGYGPIAAQRIDVWLAKRGPTAPSLPPSLCRDLTSDQARHPNDWNNPPAPPIVEELAAMSGADSVLVPVVTAKYRCTEKTRWVWGAPAYENEAGEVDCYEEALTYATFLYDASGNLMFKAFHSHELDEEPDTAAQASELLRQTPLGKPAPLSPAGRDPLDTPPPAEAADLPAR